MAALPRMRRLASLLALLCFLTVAGAHDLVTPFPKVLQSGVPLQSLEGALGQLTTFKIDVPPNAENFVVKSSGGKGDVDLLLRFNAHPTPTQYHFSSESSGTNELIRIATPEAGTWYVQVVGYSAYRGVRLAAGYELPRGTPRAPILYPPAGNYADQAIVRLSRPRGTVVRYTTDGTEPTSISPVYKERLVLTANTRVRARSFGPKGALSPEALADYTVISKGTISTIDAGSPVVHLAGQRGTYHLLKVAVPAGASRLFVQMDGGPGNAELSVRHGAPPEIGTYDRRVLAPGNYSVLEIREPAAGDWYFRIGARRNYHGLSFLATLQRQGVDLIAWAPVLQPYLSTERFGPADCEVQEGMTTAGTHRLLRFSTQTRNIGGSNLELPDPAGNPAFEYHECHGHYHFLGFASYQLLDSAGQSVATGRKVSFCLLDGLRWDRNAPAAPRYDCTRQGIQAGWADIYDSGLPGQWIDVTEVPPGTYTLVITINPDRLILENDYSNNSASVPVTIPAPSSAAPF